MKVIVGLGNPEEKHQNNRHNVGFIVVDRLASKKSYDRWSEVKKFKCLQLNLRKNYLLVKPTTYMNSSGECVKKLVDHYKVNMPDLWVIHDDLDIVLGEYKIQKGKGPKDHKGLISIYEKLGKKDFWHVRIGVENNKTRIMEGGTRIFGDDYVLQNFNEDEQEIIDNVIDKIVIDLVSRLLES